MKIAITGGHLSPAIAVIDEISKKDSILFIGRKFINDREKSFSLEFQEISKRNIPFYHLQAGRLTRFLSVRSLINILKIPLGFFQAFNVLLKEKPDAIMSFGGYIGLPVCCVGFLLRIPIYIHEQTIHPGLSNRIIGHFARKIFITFEETKKYFSADKVIMTGNPVRKNVFKIAKKPLSLPHDKLILYIMGGSVGSHSINILIEKIIGKLLEKYIVIHQTGNVKEYSDFARLMVLREKLDDRKKNNYYLREHFMEDEIGYIYSRSDLVISRAGANSFFELLAWLKPTLFIPLPWSASDEQRKHAQFFKEKGVGEIFDQSEDSEKLLLLINKMLDNLNFYKSNFKNLEQFHKQNAASFIVKTITENSS